MIGTALVEDLVQTVALTHRIKGYSRVSLLLLAAPESGKTTITTAAHCQHVCRVGVITGRSVLRELKEHPKTEFLLFNDMTSIRALSDGAITLLITMLNQITQDERGIVAFAGKEVEEITRPVGIIGCIPFRTFNDHRSKWRELGFVSRMVPFAYQYSDELVAEIKDSIDAGLHGVNSKPRRKMPRASRGMVEIRCAPNFSREIRRVSDARAKQLGELGIRLLRNYHSLARAHALLHNRRTVKRDDLTFLRDVDHFVSVSECSTLGERRNGRR